MSVYLVTGGAGFIGSNIAEELVKKGESVKVLDNFCEGKRANLEGFADKIEVIEGDIRDEELLSKVMRGVDYVIHQAALRSVPKSVDKPLLYNDVNITGTLKVLLAAKSAGVRRVVFASSSSVYGDTDVFPQKEDAPSLLISPYAGTKLAGEYYCRIFSKLYGLETVALRYFNVFGPRQSVDSMYAVVVPKFILCMLNGESPPVDGDGKQSRDFTYVENVVRANLAAATAADVSGMVFNIACGKSYSILDIVDTLNRLLGKSIEPQFKPPRQGDVKMTFADISRASSLLGLKDMVEFEEGIRRTLNWFRICQPT